jgi:hypothetical protein
MDWKQYESTALTYFCLANRFKIYIEEQDHCLEENQGDEHRLHISNESTGQIEFSEKMKRCQGRRNGAESNTGATNCNAKENPVDSR